MKPAGALDTYRPLRVAICVVKIEDIANPTRLPRCATTLHEYHADAASAKPCASEPITQLVATIRPVSAAREI